MQYALEIQRIDSENANRISQYNAKIAKYYKDLNEIPQDQRDQWINSHAIPDLGDQIPQPSFNELFKHNPAYKRIFPSVINKTDQTH
jgi:hypothetical protein